MHRHRRLALIGLSGLLLAACSRVPPGGEVAGGFGPAGAAEQAQAPGNQSGVAQGIAGAQPGTSSTGSSSTTASSASSSATSAGGGGATGVQPIASWQGVTPTTIQVAYAAKLHNCSESNDSTQSSAGTWTQKYANILRADLEYIDKYIPLPGGRKLQLVGNDTTFGVKLVDDGGAYCPNTEKAAARYVASSLRPFAAIGGEPTASGPAFGKGVADGHVISVDLDWPTAASMHADYPYAWGAMVVGQPGDEMMGYLADYVHKRMQPTQYQPPAGTAQPRKYGVMIWSDPFYDSLAAATQQLFAQFGMSVNVYRIPSDASTAAQEEGTIALKMKSDGVNTMIWGLIGGGIAAAGMSNAFDAAAYNPDNLVCYYGVAFWDTDFSHTQWARTTGIGLPAIIAERNDTHHYTTTIENSDAYDDVWQHSQYYDGQGAQSNADGYTIWTNLMTLVAGLERSPVNFTPTSWAQALVSLGDPALRCPVEQFIGRDHPQAARVAWTADNPAGGMGYTSLYWVNKTSDFGTPGYYESYDGYYAYFGLNDLPDKPSDDTAGQAIPPIKQMPTLGLSPFKSCKSIGLQGDLYQ